MIILPSNKDKNRLTVVIIGCCVGLVLANVFLAFSLTKSQLHICNVVTVILISLVFIIARICRGGQQCRAPVISKHSAPASNRPCRSENHHR